MCDLGLSKLNNLAAQLRQRVRENNPRTSDTGTRLVSLETRMETRSKERSQECGKKESGTGVNEALTARHSRNQMIQRLSQSAQRSRRRIVYGESVSPRFSINIYLPLSSLRSPRSLRETSFGLRLCRAVSGGEPGFRRSHFESKSSIESTSQPKTFACLGQQ